jgi:glycerol uptake facilitator-like aquaporin
MKFLGLVSETVGTFLLVTSILFTGNWLIIGLTLAGIIYITGNISGGHMNPAVSVAMYLKGSMSAAECIGYSLSQILGSVIALVAFKHFT